MCSFIFTFIMMENAEKAREKNTCSGVVWRKEKYIWNENKKEMKIMWKCGREKKN